MRSLLPLLASTLLVVAHPCLAEEEGPATNLRAYQLLSARIGDSLSAAIPQGDSVRFLLSVKPDGAAWLIEGGIAQALQKRGCIVVVALPAAYQADLGVLEMRVVYGEVRREGLFGGKVVDREVRLNMGARLVDQHSGVLVLNREFREAMHDTVQVSEIQTLEDPNVPITQGTLPGEGFFSSLAEPLIMLGAVAVAVYLLFTVRS